MRDLIQITLIMILFASSGISQQIEFENKEEIHNFLIGGSWEVKTIEGGFFPFTTLPSVFICDSSRMEYTFVKSTIFIA